MNLSDLSFEYPDKLIATEPIRPSRVMYVSKEGEPQELTIRELLDRIPSGDVLVVNDTKVMKRRVFSKEGFEILFIEEIKSSLSQAYFWKVLFPASRLKKNQTLELPEGVTLRLVEQGLPQIVEVSYFLSEEYFEKNGEYPLPPYIQKSRNERHNSNKDADWYQTSWATQGQLDGGSQAAPTASLHFSKNDLEVLKNKGVEVLNITLHVGLGTFLPIKVQNLLEHKMHSEKVYVSTENWQKILNAKISNKKIWAMGTTAARTLESLGSNLVPKNSNGDYFGETDIFIFGNYNWKMVDRLLTNFHQPETTLLALVASFNNLETVKRNYKWAIENNFRLFSYGDLTVWQR